MMKYLNLQPRDDRQILFKKKKKKKKKEYSLAFEDCVVATIQGTMNI